WRVPLRGERLSVGGGVVAVVEPEQDDYRTPTTIAVLSATDGSLRRPLETPSDQDHVGVSPDGRLLSVATEDEWRIQDIATGEVRHRFTWPQRAFHWADSI